MEKIKLKMIIVTFIIYLSLPFCTFHNKNDNNKSQNYNEMNIEEISVCDASETKKEIMLNAKAAVLYDTAGKRSLYSKNEDEILPMASTTKIMTCIIALEHAKPTDIVNVSAYAASMPDVQLNIRKGEQYYLKDLLYSLMLESHNDVAAAIAEQIGSSILNRTNDVKDNTKDESKECIKAFTDEMTKKARMLGCSNTSFITPNGLDADNHYTTAKELAIIASYAIENEDFISITNTKSYSFSSISGKYSHTVNNKNNFLNIYSGAIGCKTGFTSKAGYCFVGCAKRDGNTLVSVVLASGWPPHKTYKWTDTIALMNYGFNNYYIKEIIKESIKLKKIAVTDAIATNAIRPYINENIDMLVSQTDSISIKIILPKKIKAPIKKEAVLGCVQVIINDSIYREIPIYSSTNVKKTNYMYFFNKYIRCFLLQ